MGHKHTTLFRFVKPSSENFRDFAKITSLGSELTQWSGKQVLFGVGGAQITDDQLFFELGNGIFSLGPQRQDPGTVRQQRETVVGKHRRNALEFRKDIKCRFVRGKFQVHEAVFIRGNLCPDRIASVELGRTIIPWMGEGKGLCEISAVAPLGLESRI